MYTFEQKAVIYSPFGQEIPVPDCFIGKIFKRQDDAGNLSFEVDDKPVGHWSRLHGANWYESEAEQPATPSFLVFWSHAFGTAIAPFDGAQKIVEHFVQVMYPQDDPANFDEIEDFTCTDEGYENMRFVAHNFDALGIGPNNGASFESAPYGEADRMIVYVQRQS